MFVIFDACDYSRASGIYRRDAEVAEKGNGENKRSNKENTEKERQALWQAGLRADGALRICELGFGGGEEGVELGGIWEGTLGEMFGAAAFALEFFQGFAECYAQVLR